MAKIKMPSASVGMFDLNSIGSSLTTQLDLTRSRQKTESKAQSVTQAAAAAARKASQQVADESMASSAQTRQQQMEILGGLQGQIEKANTAIALADSDNPLDRLSLWFLQQSDPSYTREGNLARMAYLQDAASALGNMEVINQGEYQDQLAQIQNDLADVTAEQQDQLAIAKLAEVQGQELIDAEVNAQTTRLGMLQTQNSMQQQAMLNLTDEQIGKAVQTAASSPNQAINVGGVDISLAALQARQQDVDTRRYNEAVMRSSMADLAVANLTPEELTQLQQEAAGAPGRAVDVQGVKIPLGKITDRLYALQDQEYGRVTQEYGIAQMQEDLLRKSQGNILATMQVAELESIIDNGYIDASTGLRYSPEAVRMARDSRAAEDSKRAMDGALMANTGSPLSSVTDTAQYIDSIMPNITPTSPAAPVLATAKAQTQYAATLMNTGNAEQQKVAYQLLTAARESADAALTAEAKRLAGGDSDLEAAYKFQLRGEAIPQDLIETTLSERVQKGTPIGRWLSPAQNALYTARYRSALAAAQAPGSEITAKNGGIPMSATDAKVYAAGEAMNALKTSIGGQLTDGIMAMQAATPGHPVYNILSPEQLLTMIRTADQQGAQQFAAGARLSPDQVAQMAGTPELIAAQNAALYAALERKKPGLGDAYVKWWQSPERETMVSRYVGATMDSKKNDFSALSEFSLVAPSMQASMADQSMLLQQGQDSLFQQELLKEHTNFVTFGNNPQNKQIFLLEQTPGLTNTEKQIAMQQVIQPLLDQAAAAGYENAEQVTQFVETRLRTLEPQSPQARTVLRKMMSQRDAAMKVVDDLVGMSREFSVFGSAGPLSVAGANRTLNESARYGWYTSMLAGDIGALPQPRMNAGMQ